MDGYKVKFKRVDTGKYWICGDVKEGKYGLQAGMKMTEELKAYFDSIAIGQWVNLSIDKPYNKEEPHSASAKSAPRGPELNDEIPFSWIVTLGALGLMFASGAGIA